MSRRHSITFASTARAAAARSCGATSARAGEDAASAAAATSLFISVVSERKVPTSVWPSTPHLQPRAAEEAVDAVEIDDQRYAFALFVEIAFAFGRLLVDAA